MSTPIPSSVYAAVAERLGVEKRGLFYFDATTQDYTYYHGPTDAAEFLHAVREPMRAWLQDHKNLNSYCLHLDKQFMCGDSHADTFTRWLLRTCTPEQQVRALASAMGIEVGDE